MIDILLGVAVLFAIAAGAVAAYRFAISGERPFLPLAGLAAAFAAVFGLGTASGYFWQQAATVLIGLSLLVALGLAGQWHRER